MNERQLAVPPRALRVGGVRQGHLMPVPAYHCFSEGAPA